MIVVSWAGTPAILLVIRFIPARRNAERKASSLGMHSYGGAYGPGCLKGISKKERGERPQRRCHRQTLQRCSRSSSRYYSTGGHGT
ncbi:hypothetical protein F4781DRAFT_400364 [Annulohypoxylon bovei var. microspora]|nr:hypothetical protein F4781DRAFT_400364 [Annulohypoxylon bovei var. microspora]